MWRTAFSQRVRWAVLAIIIVPLGTWLFDKLFGTSGPWTGLVAALILFLLALAWVIWLYWGRSEPGE